MTVDLNKYKDFVNAVTSNSSNSTADFMDRVDALSHNEHKVNIALLLTAAIGLAAECGEFCEIPKKIVFQGKPLDADTIFHMKRELGDVMWYWVNACRALDLDPNEVVAENVKKLEARYPGGSFDVYHSENREAGDL